MALILLAVLLAVTATQAGVSRSPGGRAARAAPTVVTVPPSTAAAPTTTSPTVPVQLVPWSGPVEHLFFHTLVINPALAFQGNPDAQGFRNYFVTVKEFRSILDQLYAKGWTLVDLHRVVAGTVRVPPGRRPVVISEDDVNYYEYERARGLGWRLALDRTGAVKVEVHDGSGVHLTNDDLVPLVDEFVALHPEFSADGAKGVLGLTGYEGLFGERVQVAPSPEQSGAVARATAIAAQLKATGWILASHTWGHIDLSKANTGWVQFDTRRWKTEAEPITGPTDVYIYPFGARPPAGSRTVAVLHDEGFTVLCDIDVVPRLSQVGGVTVMSRRHIDGLALRQQSRDLAPLFDTGAVVSSPRE